MIPAFSTLFNKTTIKATITDTFDYSTLLYSAVYGNVTAKIGNTTFHSNSNYDSSADIVIGTNSSVTFDLPVSDSLIQPASYLFQYFVKIVNQVLYAQNVNSGFILASFAASPITHATITTPDVSIAAAIASLQALGLNVRCGIYDAGNVLLASPVINSASSTQINFDSTAYSGTPTQIRIIGTNIYETDQTYDYDNCDPIVGVLCATPNCYFSQMTVTDATQYPAGVSLSRVITINYPLKNGTPVASPVVFTEASKTIGPNIFSGGYTISMVNTVTWTQTNGLLISQTLTVYVYPNVQCDAALCTIAPCVYAIFKKYLAAVKNGSKETPNLFQQVFINNGYYMNYIIAANCADTSQAARILTHWKQYLGDNGAECGCGCGDTDPVDNTEPTEIFPLYTPA